MFFRQKPGMHTDAELVSMYRETEDLALVSELFGRYTSMIYAVCIKYLRDRDDAKDAVMQVFERLPASLKAHEIANFKSWVYVTARNHCLMQLRAKRGKKFEEFDSQVMENELLLHLEENGDGDLEDDLSRLNKCIDKLDDEQQRCVRLFFLDEKCYKDISTTTGFDLNKVKSYIQNGKRNLKICMEENE
jgi:RNA polymerase sigma-70 factor (ECF subfamily)